MTGTIFKSTGTVNLQVRRRRQDALLARTTVASQSAGRTATLGSGTVGYEWDEDADNVPPRG